MRDSFVDRRRRGFTLAETLVALAVTGVVAGVVLTQMVAPARDADAAALVGTLSGLAGAVQSFRGDVGRYPAEIRLVVTPAEGGEDTCGRFLPPELLDEWQGPYLQQQVDADGIPIGDFVVRNALRRDPPARSSGSFGLLFFDVLRVDRKTAEIIEKDFDGRPDLTAGSIRWSPGADPEDGTLSFAIPVRGC